MTPNSAFKAVWDVHHHLVNETGYVDTLLREMDRIGIERTFLVAMGGFTRDLFRKREYSGFDAANQDVARAVKQHPGRLSGYGFLHLGRHTLNQVDEIKDMGLQGLKLHLSLKPYGEEEYFEVYARASELNLACLFHTGPIYMGKPLPGLKIRSENYRPIHVEPIGHEFPDLRIIIAHLGVCWNREAACVARMFPNIYVDLSGNPTGWRAGLSLATFKELFYWPGAHAKILFGSDLHAEDVEPSLNHQIGIFRGIGWSDAQIQSILHDNAIRFFSAFFAPLH